MSMDAMTSPEIAMIRRAVPEFEPVFQAELKDEDCELESFQAMSALTRWIRARLEDGMVDDVARRVFGAIETLFTDPTMPLGDALAADFVEGMWDCEPAIDLMGPRTRAVIRR